MVMEPYFIIRLSQSRIGSHHGVSGYRCGKFGCERPPALVSRHRRRLERTKNVTTLLGRLLVWVVTGTLGDPIHSFL